MAIMIVLSAWKLSNGPISLGFMTPYIESALASAHKSFRIRFDDTILTWAGWERTLDIRILNVRAFGEGDAMVASIPEISLSLSAKALLQGMIAPKSIEMFRPSLKVVRYRDGHLEVGFDTEAADSNYFMHKMFAVLLEKPDPSDVMSYLSRITIFDADLKFVDQNLRSTWRAPKAQVQLARIATGIKGDVTMDVQVGNSQASIALLGEYLEKDRRFDIGVDFNNLRPADFAEVSTTVSVLSALDVPLQGTLTFSMLTDGLVESLGFDVVGKSGAVSVPVSAAQKIGVLSLAQRINVEGIELRGRYEGLSESVEISNLTLDFGSDGKVYLPAPVDHEMPMKSLNARGRYLSETEVLELDAVEIDLQGPEVLLAANVVHNEDGFSLGTSGVIRNVEADKLAKYWPESLATDPRTWIVEHISEGHVPEARAALQMRQQKDGSFKVISLNGDMSLRDMTVDYLPPMPKVANVNATAKFTKEKFDIFVTQGNSEGLNTRKSIISLKGLNEVDQYADMDLFIKGPVKNALRVIESEPLNFSSAIGINPDRAQGNADAHLKLKFPIEHALTLKDVDVSVVAKMNAVSVENIILGQGIKDGLLDLKADTRGLDLAGNVKLGNIPASFKWRRNFGEEVAFRSNYQIASHIKNIDNLSDLGVNLSPLHGDFIEGGVGASIGLTTHDNGKGQVQVRLDLEDVSLNVPAVGWSKKKSVAGLAEVDLDIDGTRLVDIPRFFLSAGDLRVNGSASYAENGTGLSKVDIDRISFNRTDLAGAIIPGQDGGWTASFHGPSFDLAPMFDDLFKKTPDDEDSLGLKLSLSAKVDKVWLGSDRYVKQVTGTFSRSDNRWRGMNVNGSLSTGKRFDVRLRRNGLGKRLVQINADDAGDMLRALDVYETMLGGVLGVEAEFDDTKPGHPLTGEILISDYRLIKAPALAKLVGILTLTGIADALKGDGLGFSEFKVPFVMNEGVIEINDAKATGLSLGYTANGKIYTHAEVLDLKGTVVPAYALNSVLGSIPIIGTLLTGVEDGGGIFAATYEMSGPLEEPNVSVNPLTALAPGIFRNLFGALAAGTKKNSENADTDNSNRKLFGNIEGL